MLQDVLQNKYVDLDYWGDDKFVRENEAEIW
jgi:hypothetical protein